MRRLIAQEWMSIDGVVQAPGAPDEDPSDGFRHGAWALPYFDDLAQQQVVENVTEAGGFLLGRRTYEILAGYWPHASEEEQVVARPLNEKPKYVVSRSLSEPLGWDNARLLHGEVGEAVAGLKQEDGGDLLVIGSAELLRTLTGHDLVDEFRVMIDPLLLGGGKGFFPDDGVLRSLRLVDSKVTSTGAILASYARAEG
jgi:dihydrofolate reductase